MSFSLQNITMTGGMSFTSIQATGSLPFNGTTQYLLSPSNAALSFGTGDFTVECWWYQSVANSGLGFLSSIAASGLIGVQLCGDGAFTGGNAAGTYDSFLWTLPLNQWNHVALVRISGTCYAYVNGVLASSGLTTKGNNLTNTIFTVGNSYTNNFTFKAAGYISNVRVVTGLGVYTGNFTPSNRPLTSTQFANQNGSPSLAITSTTATSLLLNTTNNSSFLTDSSSYNNTMANTGAVVSQALNPFNLGNPGSILFNGTSQWLTAGAAANWTFLSNGLSDWTVEGWVYFTSTPAAGTEVMWSTSILTANIGAGLLLRATDMSLQIVRGTSGIYAMNGTSSTINWVVKTWYHIAVTYTSATATANYYVNGASYGSSVAAESRASGPPTTTLQIGRSTISPFFYMTGYISNLRIVNGVKVYTGAFTPPAGPFTSIQYTNQNGNPAAAITGTQTNLLLNTPNGAGYITDTSTNAYTITNNGTATSQSLNPWSL